MPIARLSVYVFSALLVMTTFSSVSSAQLRNRQHVLRWMGQGFGDGYHQCNPGPNSDYYNPYSAHNSWLHSQFTPANTQVSNHPVFPIQQDRYLIEYPQQQENDGQFRAIEVDDRAYDPAINHPTNYPSSKNSGVPNQSFRPNRILPTEQVFKRGFLRSELRSTAPQSSRASKLLNSVSR